MSFSKDGLMFGGGLEGQHLMGKVFPENSVATEVKLDRTLSKNTFIKT